MRTSLCSLSVACCGTVGMCFVLHAKKGVDFTLWLNVRIWLVWGLVIVRLQRKNRHQDFYTTPGPVVILWRASFREKWLWKMAVRFTGIIWLKAFIFMSTSVTFNQNVFGDILKESSEIIVRPKPIFKSWYSTTPLNTSSTWTWT